MADSIIQITDVHPSIDGEYPIDLAGFTNRDFHDIKRIANVRSQELQDAFASGDTDLFVAFAVIAMRHAGKPTVEDALWDAPVGKITFIPGEVEEAELPPASAPPSVMQSEPGGGSEQSEPKPSSGHALRSVTEDQESDPSPTGIQPSVTGVTSPLEMSAS